MGNKLNSFEGMVHVLGIRSKRSRLRTNSIRDFSEVARKDGRKWNLEYLDVRENEFGNFAEGWKGGRVCTFEKS